MCLCLCVCVHGANACPCFLNGLHILIAWAFVLLFLFHSHLCVLCFSRIYRTWTAGALFAPLLRADMKIQATPTSKNCSHIRPAATVKAVRGDWGRHWAWILMIAENAGIVVPNAGQHPALWPSANVWRQLVSPFNAPFFSAMGLLHFKPFERRLRLFNSVWRRCSF